jgi:outer membrane receptor for ferrienterochelin and colicin
MKLTIKKFEFTKGQNKQCVRFFIVFFFLIHSTSSVFSQQLRFNYENKPLSKVLVDISKKLDVRISFDAGQLEKIIVSKSVSGTTSGELLGKILEGTNYTYEKKFNTYLILKKTGAEKQQVQNGKTVLGIVFDRETGERLPYATILLPEKNLLRSTSVDGTFSMLLTDSMEVFLQIKYLGYFSLDTVINAVNEAGFLNFELLKKSQNIPTVDVPGSKLDMVDFSNQAGHFTFNPAKFGDLPNYGETDVFRALQLLPGISSFENSSQLNIRGSSADQNLVMFDGFTLYNLDHFFGVFSALNPNVIKNIQVYRGGFDSRYGERISGIVDITGKSGNHQKPEFYGGVNLISANLTAEIPVSEKFTVVAAGRRAYSDMYSTWLADALLAARVNPPQRFKGANSVIKPEFYFSDYNLKTTYTRNEKENISISLYGAKDYLNSSNTSTNTQFEINTEDINQWGNYGFGISWKKQQGVKYFTNLQIGHSGYFNDYYNNTSFLGEIQPNAPVPASPNQIINEKNNLTDYFITLQNKYDLNPNNQFEFGISAKYNEFKYYKDATRNLIYDDLNSSAFLYNVFFQDKINVGKNLGLKPGLRMNYYDETGKMYFEPRFSASYNLTDGLVLKMATGKYFQFLNKSATEQNYGYSRDFWVLADEDLHPVVSSNHYIAGAGFETKKMYFDLELYYKSVQGLQEYLFYQNPGDRQPGTPGNKPPEPGADKLSQFISGTGRAIGIDFLAKYENTNYTSWLAYSLSKATRNFNEINAGADIPAQYDQTHEIKWTNIYNYKKWYFSTLTLFTTGHPYIAGTEKDDDFNTLRTYSRLPDYFRFDVSLNYNFNLKKVYIKPGLSILNAFNTENYLDIYVRNFDVQNNPFQETTLIKAQELTLNFFVNFRF